MLRAIIRRNENGGWDTDRQSFYTIDFDAPALEAALKSGGSDGSHYEFHNLVGVEVLAPVCINGLTEAETSATASVMGIVGVTTSHPPLRCQLCGDTGWMNPDPLRPEHRERCGCPSGVLACPDCRTADLCAQGGCAIKNSPPEGLDPTAFFSASAKDAQAMADASGVTIPDHQPELPKTLPKGGEG